MTLAIIGGSGYESVSEFDLRPDALAETRCGSPSAPIRRGSLGGRQLLFLSRHGDDHSIAPHLVNYRANLLALHAAGVTRIIAINAVGGIETGLDAGKLVVCDQLIDYTWGRAHTYCDATCTSVMHVDFTDPYDQQTREMLLRSAQLAGIPVIDGAVLGVVQGPRLETAAEIERLRRDGCHLVGMTGMPEAALARELGIPYACLAVVVNAAAGVGTAPITLADISAVLKQTRPMVLKILEQLCRST